MKVCVCSKNSYIIRNCLLVFTWHFGFVAANSHAYSKNIPDHLSFSIVQMVNGVQSKSVLCTSGACLFPYKKLIPVLQEAWFPPFQVGAGHCCLLLPPGWKQERMREPIPWQCMWRQPMEVVKPTWTVDFHLPPQSSTGEHSTLPPSSISCGSRWLPFRVVVV